MPNIRQSKDKYYERYGSNMRNVHKVILQCVMLVAFVVVTAACSSDKAGNNPDDTMTNDNDVELIPFPPESGNGPDETDVVTIVDDYDYLLEIDGSSGYKISDKLFGLFLEDINYAIDGGIYAEMIKNRSFEFGSRASGEAKHGWVTLGDVDFKIIDGSMDGSFLNENNPQYARLSHSSETPAGIGNVGFLDGISVVENAVYDFSGYFKSSNYTGDIIIRLQDDQGNVYGETSISGVTDTWKKFEAEITSGATVTKGLRLYVLIEKGTVDADMISLFPRDTYKMRKNGIRKDIGEFLEALNPGFVRFPGGCVAEGKTLSSAYNWKASIGYGMEFDINGTKTYGDVATRPLGINLWGSSQPTNHPYYMSYGFGFYEFFLLCEDLNAEPIPIINAGMSCQIQGTNNVGYPAQALEIGSEEFNRYVQDALDLVEFANGDANTKWGKIRIAMGHEEPFNLRYIGIGNEQWGEMYFSRYEAFKAAFEEAALANPDLYGGIKLIVANGPVAGDRYAWNRITQKGTDYAGLVDEHYYMEPYWFLTNTNRYDTYDRSNVPVFLGEYAAKSNNMEAALAEAAYMTGLERNGDIVVLASYAPLFGNSTSTQWTPDLIWLNNHSVWGSPNYYVQKIFSNNLSKRVLKTTLTGESATFEALSGKIGVGTWMTAAYFENIKVVNNETGEVLFSEDFSSGTLDEWERIAGRWEINDGKLYQTNTASPVNTLTGDVVYIGDVNWTNYTLTLTATKTSGAEGFLIPFAVKDRYNSYHWNIGGWSNTVSCLEKISAGSKSGQIASTVKSLRIETGRPYEIKIVVNEDLIECYLDGEKMISYPIPKAESVYQVTGTGDDGSLIVKIVSVSNETKDIAIDIRNLEIIEGPISVSLLAAENSSDTNTEREPENVIITQTTVNAAQKFIYSAPKYSVSVLRIPKKQS